LLLHWDDLKPRSNEAHKWLAQAADEGDGDAALELAQHLLQSTNYTDTESAKQRLEQGVSASHSGCMIALALLLERTDKHSSTSDRMELLDRAIELDNTTALYHYGRLMYDTYLDAANDDPPPAHLVDRALDYYMKAATKGDRRSMMRIGQVYDSLAHYEDAQIWFEQSPCELFSDVMLIKYHLQGFVQDGVMLHGKKLSVYTLTDLCDKVEVLWLQVETLEDRMDRYTASQLSLFMAQHSEEATTCERWYLRSMEMAPSKESMYGLGQLCERRGDLEAAMDYYRSAAERWNDAESQYQLGLYHAQGLGGVETVNLVAAQRYLKLAASQGLEVAKEKLGSVMLSHARDLWHQQHQYQRALKQYEQAAALAPEALVELGHLYHTGFSSNSHGSFCVIVKSYKQAFSYYSEAARQGNPKAALMLGSYYEEGYLADMEENLEEALHWYEKAYRWKCGSLAELAIGKLKHSMAERLYGDNNVEAALDLQEEAYTWFEGAAEDCAHAKVMIALYHLKGWGRKPCDPTKGFDMLMCLVPENNELAWVEVALCYDQGVGVAQDVNKALVYWEMAANAGDDLVALRRVEEIYRFGLAGAVDLEKANAYGACADMIGKRKTK
jgi:TPR repeat protein